MSGQNPAAGTYTSNPWLLALSCASATGTISSASGACTMSLTGGTFDGSRSVTLSDSGETPGGTFTPSVGSSFTSSGTVTPTNSATSFTFTYTPLGSVGVRLLHFTNSFLATNPSDFTYTATSSDACNFTAKADGNWNSAGTWNTPTGCTGGGHAIPTTGDTVSITGFHVTCSTGTCYVGTAPLNNTQYDLTIAQSGATNGILEIASGAILQLAGNYKLNGSNGATSGGKLILDTGATFNHDNNNSATVSYRGSGGSSNNMNQIQVGTSTDTCTITANFGYSCPTNYKGVNLGGGLYPFLMAPPSMASAFSITSYGLGVKNCGSASAPCIDVAENTLPVNIDMENGVFASTTPIGNSYNSTNTNGTFQWINNHEVSDLAGMFSVDTAHFMTNQASCTVTGNFFDATPGSSFKNDEWGGCLFKDNVYSTSLYTFSNTPGCAHPWVTFQGNAIIQPEAMQTNDYFACVPTVAGNFTHGVQNGSYSKHMNFNMPGAQVSDFNYSGNICDKSGTTASESHCLLELGAAPHRAVTVDNLSTLAAQGDTAGSFWGYYGSGAAGPCLYASHNGLNGTLSDVMGMLGFMGHSNGLYSPSAEVCEVTANIGYSPNSGAGNWMLADGIGTASTILVASTTVVDWNDVINGTASSMYPSSTFNNRAYQLNSTAVSPGPHERGVGASLAAANPNYIDATRRGDTWASRVMGQTQDAAGLKSALWCQTESSCIGNLINWVKLGYQPTNMALKGASGDGYIIGVSGNLGTGYTPGTCTATTTIVSALDLGSGGSFGCTINSSGVPVITVTNPGAHYLISNPATVLINDGNGHTSTGLTVKLTPMDIGPVPIYNFASVAQ